GTPAEQANALVKAFRRKPPEGWRPLTWHDLTPALLGAPVPEEALPADWDGRTPEVGLTLDEIEQKLDNTATHQTLSAESQKALRDVLDQLSVRAEQPGMWRSVRKLLVPSAVRLYYWGANTKSSSSLDQSGDNEFTGTFGELREKV